MILAQSIDGCLRIRSVKNGKTAVVEIRSHLFPGEWIYCVWKSLPINEAWELFQNQAIHHIDPKRFFQPIVERGV